jgi:type I restriction enzyme, S subunit
MSEWHDVCLGDISTQRKGINYKSEDYSDQYSGHPFITIKCFAKGGGYDPSGIKYYDGFLAKSDSLEPNHILFSVTDLTRAGDIVGSPLKVPDFGGIKPAVASMDCMRIFPNPSQCDQEFLYHRLMLSDIRRQMVAYSAGSTVLHLDTKKVPIMRFKIPLEIKEQRFIATVLNTIDQTIAHTEAFIQKYQQIKAGLMHDLFTRGITSDGQLRPSREQAPELYQETAIGWIPKEWDVIPLHKFSEMSSGGTPKRNEVSFWNGNIPWVKTGEVQYNIITKTEEYISQKGLKFSSAKLFPTGTIIMAIYGEGNTRGRIAKLGIKATTNQACLAFFFKNLASNDFMYYFFEKNYLSIRDISNDGSQKNLSASLLKELECPIPKQLNEQFEITKLLAAIDEQIANENTLREKLKKQKSGLMHDLLTGKVPVTISKS